MNDQEQKKNDALMDYFMKFKKAEPKLMIEQYEYFIVSALVDRLIEENKQLREIIKANDGKTLEIK